ncbi:MAG: lipid-binding SYLF domain-containing protein [Limisphaerales bacterium]
MGLATSAFALDRGQLNNRIQSITAKFTAMEQNRATRVPPDQLARANGIILLDRTKGALIFGYHYANGLALVRSADGRWSPAGFVESSGASLGPQIGGTKDFFVVLMMTPSAVQTLKQPAIDFGAKASETFGGEHAGAKVMTESHPVMVYSEHNGAFAGASIRGGSVRVDKDANAAYYGHPVSMNGILFAHQVSRTPAEDALIAKIDEFSR